MNTKFTEKAFRILFIFVFVMGMVWTPGKGVAAQEPLPNPNFIVRPLQDFADAWGWPNGASIFLTLDDPSTPQSPDYTETEVASYSADWRPDDTLARFINRAFDIKPGDVVTMTDGITTKTHITTTLTVDDFNVNTDTISGTAEPGSEVSNVNVCDDTGCSERTVTTDQSGHWITDFSVPGDSNHPETIDIRPNTEGIAIQNDEDGDATHIGWRVPNPNFNVRANADQIEAFQWAMGDHLFLEIDNPTTTVDPDYTTSKTVTGVADWDPSQTYLSFDLSGAYDIQIGDRISVSNDTITKTTVVTNLAITNVDLDTDTVYGNAEPNQTVNIWTCWQNEPCVNRDEIADSNGHWVTNFAVPGEKDWEQGTMDLRPGSWIDSSVGDEDGDSTMFGWNVPNPTITVRMVENEVHANDWLPIGETLTLTIDDPSTPQSPDFTASQPAAAADWNPNQSWTRFTLGNFHLQPGFIVTLHGGSITKTHVVTGQVVTKVDISADTVEGSSEPNAEVWVDVWNVNVTRHVVADANGHWIADFSMPGDENWETQITDFRAGSQGEARVQDDDFDSTAVTWTVPTDTLHAVPAHSEVHGHEWPQGDTVTLTIDNDNNPNNGNLYTQTKNADDNPWCGYPCFDLSGVFTLQIGQYVTMSDATVSKTVHVSTLHVTDLNRVNNTISGIADPGSTVQVNIWSQNGISRKVQADANGDWMVDFSVAGNGDNELVTQLVPGDNGRAIQLNPDGTDDGTLEYWDIPLPVIIYTRNTGLIFGSQWNPNDTLTLNIDNPANGQGVDYTETATADGDGFVTFDLSQTYQIQPGYLITMTDGSITKSLTATNVTVTSVDPSTDKVIGTAEPESAVSVIVFCDIDPCAVRNVNADQQGNWLADFSVPGGSSDEEQLLADIKSGSYLAARQFDEDSDRTRFTWTVTVNQPPLADAGPDQTSLEGATVSLNASASSDPEGGALTYAWDLDHDGQYDDASGVAANTTFDDNGTYIVGLQVTDEGGLSNTDTATITVNNVAPMITSITAPVAPIQVANNVLVNATFNDPGADTFTAAWDWGDGTTTSGAVNGQTVTGSHFYFTPGIYTLKLTVTDDDGGAGTATYQYIVIYDTNGGFTTGGGWYVDPASGDKANFGFNAKYQKNSSIPTGNTEFKVGTLNFKSTAYDWLVVSGTRAQFKGTGTVNGSGQYAFIVTMIDGRSDLIRIKIWNSSTGAVVYDTLPGAVDDANPVMPIQGGSIVIHNK